MQQRRTLVASLATKQGVAGYAQPTDALADEFVQRLVTQLSQLRAGGRDLAMRHEGQLAERQAAIDKIKVREIGCSLPI